MKDYAIQLKVKNNHLLTVMRVRGYETASALSEACGISGAAIGKMLNLKTPARNKRGEWMPAVRQLAAFLKMPPEALYPEQHLDSPLAKNTGEVEMSLDELKRLENPASQQVLLEDHIARNRARRSLAEALGVLPPRSRNMLIASVIDGRTLKDIGKEYDVTGVRARQIINSAIRRLKHPAHNLKQALHEAFAA